MTVDSDNGGASAAIMCPFVTVTPTIGSGVVVRWFTHEVHMESCHPMVSAGREGVFVHDLQVRTSAEMSEALRLLHVAHETHGRILNGEDMRHLATHEREGMFGPFVPVENGRSAQDA